MGLRGKGRDRGWSIVVCVWGTDNGVRESGEKSTLSRVPGTVLADRFPANNWKCKRNRPSCDSSIIESLISVWMRPLSRFCALCPRPYCLALSSLLFWCDHFSFFFWLSSIPSHSLPMFSSFTCWNTSWRRVLPTNEQMRRARSSDHSEKWFCYRNKSRDSKFVIFLKKTIDLLRL